MLPLIHQIHILKDRKTINTNKLIQLLIKNQLHLPIITGFNNLKMTRLAHLNLLEPNINFRMILTSFKILMFQFNLLNLSKLQQLQVITQVMKTLLSNIHLVSMMSLVVLPDSIESYIRNSSTNSMIVRSKVVQEVLRIT